MIIEKIDFLILILILILNFRTMISSILQLKVKINSGFGDLLAITSNQNDNTRNYNMSDFTTPLYLKPCFSKRFTIILIILHCGALLWLLLLKLPLRFELVLVIKLSLGFLILTSAFFTTRQHLLLINHPLYGCILTYDENTQGIKVQLQSKTEAKIVPGSYNHPQLVVLRLKNVENGKINTLVIFPDALDVQIFRQLRVHLRHGADSYKIHNV